VFVAIPPLGLKPRGFLATFLFTAEKLGAMAQLMEDDIREELHQECPDDPAEFFARYVERVGPERAGEVWFA